MTHAWKQSIDINETKAQKLIESQWPLQVTNIRLLDEGWDNLVYLINDSLIFRFPRREFGVVCIANEIALLPYVASQVSFPLSAPQFIGKPSKIYPYSFAGYPRLGGEPVSDVCPSLIDDLNFARTLASWLAQLHAVSVKEEHRSLFQDTKRWQYDVAHRIARCKENLSLYGDYFLQLGFTHTCLLEIINLLPKLTFKDEKKSYVHADLYSRHVLMNPQTELPTGLIDWGDMHIGQPGLDLAVAMIFTESAFLHFLTAYGHVNEATRHLLLFHAFCHQMSFLPYTCEQNKVPLQHWASLALQRAIEEIKKFTGKIN